MIFNPSVLSSSESGGGSSDWIQTVDGVEFIGEHSDCIEGWNSVSFSFPNVWFDKTIFVVVQGIAIFDTMTTQPFFSSEVNFCRYSTETKSVTLSVHINASQSRGIAEIQTTMSSTDGTLGFTVSRGEYTDIGQRLIFNLKAYKI